MEALVHQKKKGINFSKAKTKFYLNLHYKSDNIYLFENGKEIYKLIKLIMEMLTFHFDFVLEAQLKYLTMLIRRKHLLREMCMIFLVDYDAIYKSNHLKIHKYLMIKNSV